MDIFGIPNPKGMRRTAAGLFIPEPRVRRMYQVRSLFSRGVAGGGSSVLPNENEPGGMTKIMNRTFEQTAHTGDNKVDANQIFDGGIAIAENALWTCGEYDVISDATAPISPSNVGRITHRAPYQVTNVLGTTPNGTTSTTITVAETGGAFPYSNGHQVYFNGVGVHANVGGLQKVISATGDAQVGNWTISNVNAAAGTFTIPADTSVDGATGAGGTARKGLLSGFDPKALNFTTGAYQSASNQVSCPANTAKWLYLSIVRKLSVGFVPPPANVVKMGFLVRQPDHADVILAIRGSAPPYTLAIIFQGFAWTNPFPAPGMTRNLGSVGDDYVYPGQWWNAQVLLKMNSAAGAFDGDVDVWFNGDFGNGGVTKHVMSTQNAPYDGLSGYNKPPFWDAGSETPNGYWEGWRNDPTWGGSDNNPLAATQFIYDDNHFVSYKP